MTSALYLDQPYLQRCSAIVTALAEDTRAVMLDQTVFYAQGGGQPGDTGELVLGDGQTARIIDTRKGAEPDTILHLLAEDAPLPPPGTHVEAVLDWPRRYAHMRMHTALHLLCSLVPGEVTGGQVSTDKGRLDFNVPSASLDKAALSEALQALVDADHPVAISAISEEDLAAKPDLVRTMSVKPPTGNGSVRLIAVEGIDLQPCGGTHIARTGEIGPLMVSKIENKGKQNRRVTIAFAKP